LPTRLLTADRSPPRNERSYYALKLRFSATLGEEPGVEVGLV
jgi:hypothetical protein